MVSYARDVCAVLLFISRSIKESKELVEVQSHTIYGTIQQVRLIEIIILVALRRRFY